MSFSCPHFEMVEEKCLRVGQPCVPGRPGCVLRANSVFAVPVDERLENRFGREDDAEPRPGDEERSR